MAALVAAFAFAQGAASPSAFEAWIFRNGRIETLGDGGDRAIPVGSLQKPFLTRAWARTHPSGATPRFMCSKNSGCWRPQGHGELDLRSAIRESCNTYFRELVRHTPHDAIETALKDAGFSWSGDFDDAEAIGLPGPAHVAITPARLIDGYGALMSGPWPARDDIRDELLLGMKDSAGDGTAQGLELFGLRAKTGTVPQLDGKALATSGLVFASDDAGFAFLGVLRTGTGREAAIRAGREIAKLRPDLVPRNAPSSSSNSAGSRRRRPLASTSPAFDAQVRVEMLGELRLKTVRLTNRDTSPLLSSRGYIGSASTVEASVGEKLGYGSWEIASDTPPFKRRVRASLEVSSRSNAVTLIATMPRRTYADGVVRAELSPSSPSSLRAALAAAVLRFASGPARHQNADVCDSTHCAWFVADGPVPRWLRPDRASIDFASAPDLTDSEWLSAVADARANTEGPDVWSADCGGEPLSRHFVWGDGDRRVFACARHPKGSRTSWRREWTTAAIAKSLGDASEIGIETVNGQWMLRANLRNGSSRLFSYDDAHRRLAAELGWDSLPSPASRVIRTPQGFAAEGVGYGHRVGLCLAP